MKLMNFFEKKKKQVKIININTIARIKKKIIREHNLNRLNLESDAFANCTSSQSNL